MRFRQSEARCLSEAGRFTPEGIVRIGEVLADRERTGGPQDTVYLGKCLPLIGDLIEDTGKDDVIDAFVG